MLDFMGYRTNVTEIDDAIKSIENTFTAHPQFDMVSFERVRSETLDPDASMHFKMLDGEVKELTKSAVFDGFQILTSDVWETLIDATNESNYWYEVENVIYKKVENGDMTALYDLTKVSRYRGRAQATRDIAQARIIESMGYGAFWDALVINEACTGTYREYHD